MMQMRQKPSGIWLVDYVDDGGVRRRVSTGTKDKDVARAKARDIVMGRALPEPGATTGSARETVQAVQGLTVEKLFDHCLKDIWSPRRTRSQRTVLSNVKILTALVVTLDGKPVKFGGMLVTGLTTAVLKAVAAALRDQGYAPATVKRKMDMVGRSLTEAAEAEFIVARPRMPTLGRIDNFKNRVLSDAEEAAMFAAIDARAAKEPQRPWLRFKHLIRWLLDTGCRLGETLKAQTGWIEAHSTGRAMARLPAWATKTQKERTVPLSTAIAESIPYLRLTAVEDRLFPMGANTAWYMFGNIKDDLAEQGFNLDDVVLHTLRHTCITRLVKSRMPLNRVSKWAGHANIKITHDRYAHLDVDDVLEGADIIDARPALRLVSAA